MKAHRRQDLRRWCDAVLKDDLNLTAWERDFIRRMDQRLRYGQELSEKEADKLEEIYAERTP